MFSLFKKYRRHKADYRDFDFVFGEDLAGYSLLSSSESDPRVLYREIRSYIYSAIVIRSEDVAKTVFRVYRQTAIKGELHAEELFDHPACSLISCPNRDLSWYELIQLTVQNMDACGDFYWLKLRNRLGSVRYFIPVFPSYITIIPGQYNFVKTYHYKDRQTEYDIDVNDIIHFKHPKSNNLHNGQSIIAAIADVVNVNNLQLSFQIESFNQPLPSASLSTEQPLDESTARRLQSEFKLKYGGVKKSSSIPVLDRGLRFTVHKKDTREIDFVRSRKGLRDEILSAFRVPANKLGIVTDTNRANAEAANFSYLSNAIEPLCLYISIKLTQDFRREYDDPGIVVKNDDVVPRDVDSRLRYYDSGLKYRWLDINEVRAEEGYKPKKENKNE